MMSKQDKHKSFRQWCKSIVYRQTDKFGETITTIEYKDGTIEKHYNDGSFERITSNKTLEELKQMFETETGNSW
tara:strand:+ start:508 stop:729 length:222 start_codon:yes stop_codon:yes gene_type:complete